MLKSAALVSLFICLVCCVQICGHSGESSQQITGDNKKTQIVLLGTGTPNADPDRFGPSVAIVVNNTPYLVDFGPGVVRRAAAAFKKGVTGLAVRNLNRAFVTHLHSDHTAGLPDLILTPWVWNEPSRSRYTAHPA